MSRYKVGKYKYVCDVCHEIIDDKNYMIVADFSLQTGNSQKHI